MHRLINAGLAAIALCASVIPAQASSVQSVMYPGQMLVVTFGFSSPPTTQYGPVDFIAFGGGASFTDFFTEGRSSYVLVSIFDGETLLGTKNVVPASQYCNCTFVSPGSPGTTPFTVDIDMSSIVNGTIDGRIEYVPFFDAPSEYSVVDQVWRISTGHYVGYGSYWVASPEPIIYSHEVVQVVPAPPAAWLLGTAFAGLGGRKWLRSRAH